MQNKVFIYKVNIYICTDIDIYIYDESINNIYIFFNNMVVLFVVCILYFVFFCCDVESNKCSQYQLLKKKWHVKVSNFWTKNSSKSGSMNLDQ